MTTPIVGANIKIIYENGDQLEQVTVRLAQSDKIAFERYCRKRDWDPSTPSPFIAPAYWGWAALQRSPDCPTILRCDFETFVDRIVDIGADAVEIHPTKAVVASASPSKSLSTATPTHNFGSTPTAT